MSENSVRKAAVSDVPYQREAETGPLPPWGKPFGLRTGSDFAFASHLVLVPLSIRIQNGNSSLSIPKKSIFPKTIDFEFSNAGPPNEYSCRCASGIH